MEKLSIIKPNKFTVDQIVCGFPSATKMPRGRQECMKTACSLCGFSHKQNKAACERKQTTPARSKSPRKEDKPGSSRNAQVQAQVDKTLDCRCCMESDGASGVTSITTLGDQELSQMYEDVINYLTDDGKDD